MAQWIYCAKGKKRWKKYNKATRVRRYFKIFFASFLFLIVLTCFSEEVVRKERKKENLNNKTFGITCVSSFVCASTTGWTYMQQMLALLYLFLLYLGHLLVTFALRNAGDFLVKCFTHIMHFFTILKIILLGEKYIMCFICGNDARIRSLK